VCVHAPARPVRVHDTEERRGADLADFAEHLAAVARAVPLGDGNEPVRKVPSAGRAERLRVWDASGVDEFEGVVHHNGHKRLPLARRGGGAPAWVPRLSVPPSAAFLWLKVLVARRVGPADVTRGARCSLPGAEPTRLATDAMRLRSCAQRGTHGASGDRGAGYLFPALLVRRAPREILLPLPLDLLLFPAPRRALLARAATLPRLARNTASDNALGEGTLPNGDGTARPRLRAVAARREDRISPGSPKQALNSGPAGGTADTARTISTRLMSSAARFSTRFRQSSGAAPSSSARACGLREEYALNDSGQQRLAVADGSACMRATPRLRAA